VAKIGVIYDFHDDGLKPFTLIVQFDPNELNDGKRIKRIPLTAPFERMMADELEEAGLGVSVLLEDITASSLHPHSFGIDMNSIAERHTQECPPSLDEVDRFIVRLCDIEEVLESDLQQYYR
jgi:hypothetical protein